MDIIFDVGAVLVDWNPDKIVNQVFSNKSLHETVKKQVFGHPEWSMLDKGTINEKDVSRNAAERCNLDVSEIKKLMDEVPKSLTLIPETLEIVTDLKKSNHRLFILSNMYKKTLDYLEKEYSFWDLFHGKVFSCQINMVKPDEEIYKYILNKYDLVPEETLFIDDSRDNIDAASRLGIQVIQFDSPDQCRSELLNKGYL